jgi:hypothetical protein
LSFVFPASFTWSVAHSSSWLVKIYYFTEYTLFHKFEVLTAVIIHSLVFRLRNHEILHACYSETSELVYNLMVSQLRQPQSE